MPNGLNVAGLWFDTAPWFGTPPAASDLSGGARAVVHEGPQSIGNYLSTISQMSNYFPGAIARDFYNFPLAGKDVPTTTVGLIEPGIGDAMPSASPTFLQGLNAYRQAAGVATPGEYYVVGNVAGQSYAIGNNGERSLDVGVIASAAPGSKIGLYPGSGFNAPSHANVFTSYQTAFWDTVNNPTVLSSSFSIFPQTNPSSVFHNAIKELFIDGALRGVTMVQANNDFGSSWDVATGLANQVINSSSPFMLLVGGTSLTTIAAAPFDPTIASDPSGAASLYGLAMSGDVAALWRLVEGGLTKLPSAASGTEAEPATPSWKRCGTPGSSANGHRTPKLGASDGGVDTTQPTPWYQTAFGLAPTSANPGHATGRGAPDVSADSGGNMFYAAPNGDFSKIGDDEGTSAATPLWASLMAQVDTIFADQGLPHLGFANDLLYIAGAIAPGSFNDITFGNNVTSYIDGAFPGGATVIDADGNPITLTGYGYFAGPGYDLTTGLGSPNGVLLSRAMTAIGHSQMSYSSSPDMLDAAGAGWTSGADQSLMFQTMSASATTCGRRHRHGGPRLLEPGVRYLRLDQPAGAAGAAVRLRSSPGAAVRQAGAGLGRAVRRRGGRTAVGLDQCPVDRGAPGLDDQPVRFRRLHLGERRGARGAPGGRRRDGRRGRRHGRGRARAPERRGQPVAHLLSRRRPHRHDRRPAAPARRAMPRRRKPAPISSRPAARRSAVRATAISASPV